MIYVNPEDPCRSNFQMLQFLQVFPNNGKAFLYKQAGDAGTEAGMIIKNTMKLYRYTCKNGLDNIYSLVMLSAKIK